MITRYLLQEQATDTKRAAYDKWGEIHCWKGCWWSFSSFALALIFVSNWSRVVGVLEYRRAYNRWILKLSIILKRQFTLSFHSPVLVVQTSIRCWACSINFTIFIVNSICRMSRLSAICWMIFKFFAANYEQDHRTSCNQSPAVRDLFPSQINVFLLVLHAIVVRLEIKNWGKVRTDLTSIRGRSSTAYFRAVDDAVILSVALIGRVLIEIRDEEKRVSISLPFYWQD